MSKQDTVKAYLQTFLICIQLGIGLTIIELIAGINFWIGFVINSIIGGIVGYLNMRTIVKRYQLLAELEELYKQWNNWN